MPEETSIGTDDPSLDAPPRAAASTRRLLDALDLPVALVDLDGGFLHANDDMLRCFGLERDELAGRSLLDLSDDRDATAALLRLWAGSTGRRPGTLALDAGARGPRRLRCDGARLDAGTLLIRLRAEDEPDRLAMLSRDVEATTLRELQHRLRAAVGELEEANRQLGTRNSELERYATAVAHDLRTPLYIMRGYVELLAGGQVADVDESGRELLAEVLLAADRMGSVIDGLLLVARLQVTTPDAPIDSAAAMDVVLHELRDEVARTGARFEVGPLEPAWCEATHLVQVLSNLIGNSLKFSGDGQPPTVWVASDRQDATTRFVVEDDGPGVPPGDRERIFDLFDRGGAVPDEPGTGIGLATCRKIVESYGGSIRCEASEHGGARFVFTITDPVTPTTEAAAPRS